MYQELDGWQTVKGDICLKSAKKQGNGKIEEYQNWELQTAISHCAKLRIAVDIGAHVGITSFRLSRNRITFTFIRSKLIENDVNLYLKDQKYNLNREEDNLVMGIVSEVVTFENKKRGEKSSNGNI